MATRQSKNYGLTLQDNNEFVDIETTAENFEIVDEELKKLSDKVDDNASSIEELEAAAVAIAKEIASLKNNQESGGAVSQEVSAKITALESQLVTVNSNITNLKTRTTALEKDMNTAESDIDNLETDISNLEAKMSTAESDIDNIETDMSNAKKSIDDLNGKVPSTVPGAVLYSGSGKVSEDIIKYRVVIVNVKEENATQYNIPVLCSVRNTDNAILLYGMTANVESNKNFECVYIKIEKSTMNVQTSQISTYKWTASNSSFYYASFKEIIGVI